MKYWGPLYGSAAIKLGPSLWYCCFKTRAISAGLLPFNESPICGVVPSK